MSDSHSSLVNMLATMMDPRRESASSTAPEIGTNEGNSIPGDVQFSCSFDIEEQASIVYPQVTILGADPITYPNSIVTQGDIPLTTSGLYMSFPQESVQSRYHMALMPSGSAIRKKDASAITGSDTAPEAFLFDKQPTNVRGLSLRNIAMGPRERNRTGDFRLPPYDQSVEKAWALVYDAELAIPRVGTNNGFDITPPLDENYSKVREYAGVMALKSSTTSGTKFTLSGTFASGVIADTRDICQVRGANGSVSAYPVSALSTQSVSNGSVLKASTVEAGVIELTGPDYPRDWTAPDVDKTDTLHGEFFTSKIEKFNNTPYLNLPFEVGAFPIQTVAWEIHPADIFQAWVSPWQTRMWTALNTQTAPAPVAETGNADTPSTWWNQVTTTPINEDGVLDVDVSFGLTATLSVVNQDYIELSVKVNFLHVFVYVDTNGFAQYNTFPETQMHTWNSREQPWADATGGEGASAVPELTFKGRPRMLRNGFAMPDGGKYLGTLVTASVHIHDAFDSGAGGNVTVGVIEPRVSVRARNLDAKGRVGPAHIVRYDQLAAGQTLQLQGMALVQGVAKGNIAPFIKGGMGGATVSENAFNRIVEALFRNSKYFVRITTMKHYCDVILPFIRDMTAETILDILKKAPREQAEAAIALGQAAGLFGDIGGLIGSGIDAISGNTEGRGAAIGAGIGGAVDGLAAGGYGCYGNRYHQGYPGGQFSGDQHIRGDAASMFGRAASQFGQMGDASGMFGAAGSRRLRD